MLRLFLPPNLVAAAARDAIAVRVEADLEKPPDPAVWAALALLQRWCNTPTPPQFIQLTRAQLRELVSALVGQPRFFWLNQPASSIPWGPGGTLVGVSAHLAAIPLPAATKEQVLGQAPVSPAKPADNDPGRPVPRRATASPPSSPLVIDGSENFLALTLPSRESNTYPRALDLVKTHGFILEPSNRKWWLRDRHKVLNFLASEGPRLLTGADVQLTANFVKNTAHFRPAEIVAEAVEERGDFAVTVGLRAGKADEGQLRAAVASNRSYLESEGLVYLVDGAKLERLTAAQRAFSGQPGGSASPRGTYRVAAARVAEAQEILEELSPGFQAPATWRTRADALRNLSQLAPAPVSAPLDRQLRPYQRLGVAWLWHLYQHELGGILADEMGLGKTLQALGLLTAIQATAGETVPVDSRSRSGRPSPAPPPRTALVVCPASLLENWRRETARFAPQLRIFVHHGDQRLAGPGSVGLIDLVITSYGTLARDRDRFSELEFACVIADEAQHIKNRRSQNATALRALRSRGRFLLTGTPLENSLADLRSLFEFLLPGYLAKVPAGIGADERAWFDDRLRAQVAPYILRRTKQAVAPELPAKIEQVLWCELTAPQAKLYREVQETSERELFDLEASGASENNLRLAALTQLLRLRQVCCDPRLVPLPAGRGGLAPASPDEGAGSPAAPFTGSTKLNAFRELVDEAVDDGHRVLVFSQFTSLLALLREEFATIGTAYCYLDGSMSPRARQAEVDRFQADANVPIFLLSLKAGGTGLNLAGADTVIHLDPWWNPAVEAQATDRAHRIGQSRTVTSYKLVATNTVEEKVLGLQEEKRALLAGIFEASDASTAKLSLGDLKTLLSRTPNN